VVTRGEFSLAKARKALKGETIAVLGYGVQAPAQALNLKDNGFNVIIGARDWSRAKKDGWKPGKDLFSLEEAADQGTILLYLVSDAGQRALWPTMKKFLTPGKALAFSHGFSDRVQGPDQGHPAQGRGRDPGRPEGLRPERAPQLPRGRGHQFQLRRLPGRHRPRQGALLALGIGIGSGYLFPTTFQKEVVSDLTGERGVLMGALAGIMEAQYEVLRKNGHSPSEAFNETVEELTQSLIRLVDEKGMDWMYANCSTTAQRGALDWKPKFKKATLPVFKALYKSVKTGKETARVLSVCSGKSNYKELLAKELNTLGSSEMWQAGAAVRSLRPKTAEAPASTAKGTGGRTMG
jgi:ketol-acid reductoisomerase